MFLNKHKKHDWSNDGSFVSRPKHGWLHENELLHPDVGISYAVKYTGSVSVLESMRALDFDTRTSITNESINRLCHSLKGSQKFKKNHKLDKFLGPHLNYSKLNDVILTITTESLTISDSISRELIHQHMMPSISFASGGEPETQDFVAYVAKGDMGRCCYVFECKSGLARDVITTIGQAFEIRFKHYLSHKAAPLTVPDCIPMATSEAEYYNDRPDVQPPSPELRHCFERGSGDMEGFAQSHHQQQHYHHRHRHHHHHHHHHDSKEVERFPTIPSEYQYPKSNQPVRSESERGFEQNRHLTTSSSSSSSQDMHHSGRSLESFQLGTTSESVDGGMHASSSRQSLSPYHEIWFHGKISREKSEDLLLRSGDFLVRESPKSPGQFVLSGRQGNCMKHLLLVDPEGKVRTKDQLFNSVSHLVNYHQYNQVPIISNDSELLLINPIHCTMQQF